MEKNLSAPNSGRGTIIKLLENMHTAPETSSNNRLPSNQRIVSVSMKPGTIGAQVLKEPCGTSAAVQPQGSQELQDESYGFKILSVCSLARIDESPGLFDQISKIAAKSDVVTELKPAPSAGHASRNAKPCSKTDKLKAAINLLEKSVIVQDTGLFSEAEKNILTSLLHRFNHALLTTESEAGNKCPEKPPPCSSKFAIKADPTPVEGHSCDSFFDALGNVKLENLASERESILFEHPVKAAIKREPTSSGRCSGDFVQNVQQEEDSAGGTAKRGHCVTVPRRPLRRIVITSDIAPIISSDEVKTAIQTFLVRNNISNNFAKDEVIKLHWDGKDVSTFHFSDADHARSPLPLPPPVAAVPQNIKPNILMCSKPATPATSVREETSGAATITASAGGQTVAVTTLVKAETLPEQPKVFINGPTVPAGYKAVGVKWVTDSNQAVLTPLGSVLAERGGTSVEKQLCIVPQAVRYTRKTGEVLDHILQPGQPGIPIVAPVGTKTAPLNEKSAICLTSSTAPVVYFSSVKHVLSGVQTNTQRLIPQPQPAKPIPTVVKTTAVPVTAPHIVHVNKEGPNPKPQSLEVGYQEGLWGSVKMPQATPQRPVYPDVRDVAARILEPEVLLEVSNKVIQVQSLKDTRLDDSSSSSSSTSSCCSEDLVPPVQTRNWPVAQGRKRASSKSSIQREYRSHKHRRQGNRQERPARPLDVKPSKASSDEKNVAILSSNCIDRPCVVSMYRLNDRLMKKGFVNLASTKHKELFALARGPEVRLAPDKVVSVVQLCPCQTESSQEVVVTHVSESVPQEMETDSVEDLLTEQMNYLVQLRKKYQHFSS